MLNVFICDFEEVQKCLGDTLIECTGSELCIDSKDVGHQNVTLQPEELRNATDPPSDYKPFVEPAEVGVQT